MLAKKFFLALASSIAFALMSAIGQFSVLPVTTMNGEEGCQVVGLDQAGDGV
jgi:hypothetical protein